jgi:hypothetical protein
LNQVIKHGVHAVAVDERRADFTPTLWNPDGRIMQAVFPGCHSDVGGGFVSNATESGLSDCTLQWMTDQLTALGVTFQDPPAYTLHPNACATAHATWLTGIWRYLPQGPRSLPAGLYVSKEVVERMAAVGVIPDPSLPAGPYAPANLPPEPTVA